MENLPARRQPPTQLTRYDAKSADVLFSSYGGRLYAYFRLMLANEAAAKRALAGTLMTAAADPGWPRDPSQHAPRLFALAHAECHKRHAADAVDVGQHWTVADWTHAGHWPGLSEVARRAVSRLSPDVREAFILSAPHNHLSLPQLAEILGLGLDAAADLRAQAGLDFVRAVQSCARDADFTEFSGSDLRIRAEESLARDAAEPPPSLPVLSDPALAVFWEDAGPSSAPASAPPMSAPPTLTDLPSAPLTAADLGPPAPIEYSPGADVPGQASFHAHPDVREPDLEEEEDFPGEADLMGRAPAPGDLNEFGREPDSTLHDVLPGGLDHYGGPDYYDGPGEYGPGEYGPRDVFDGGPGYPAGPGQPLVRKRPRRRGRVALAWAGGGIVAVAAAVIGANALMTGPGHAIRLSPSDVPPSGAVMPGGLGPPTASPRASQPRHVSSAAASHGTSSSGMSGLGSQSSGGAGAGQPAPQPAPSSPAPVHATTAPAPAPTTKPTVKPTVKPPTSPPVSPTGSTPPATTAAS